MGTWGQSGDDIAYQPWGLADVWLRDVAGRRERKLGNEPTGGPFVIADATRVIRSGGDCLDMICDRRIVLHRLDRCLTMELVRTSSDLTESFHFAPQLVADRLYYIEGNTKGNSIVELELTTGRRRAILGGSPESKIVAFDLEGDWLAIHEIHPASGSRWPDLRVHNLATGESRWVTETSVWDWSPRISNGRVYWSNASLGVVPPAGQLGGTEDEHDIYAYDLATGVTTAVVTAPGSQMLADVRGDELLWLDTRDGGWFPENRGGLMDVWLGDLSTGVQRRLTHDPRPRWDLKFFGEGFAWTQDDGPPGASDDRVWMAPLPVR